MIMTLRIILPLLLVMHTPIAGAQDIRDVFVAMPDSLLPTLTRNDRLDLIDFFDAGLDNTVSDALHGRSHLTMLTPSVLKLQLNDHAEIQMCRPGDTDVICLIHSVEAGGWDSKVKFFGIGWKPLEPAEYITLPTLADFMPLTADTDLQEYKNRVVLVGFPLIRADITDDTTITFSFTSANEADRDFSTKVKPHIRQQVQRKIRKPADEVGGLETR